MESCITTNYEVLLYPKILPLLLCYFYILRYKASKRGVTFGTPCIFLFFECRLILHGVITYIPHLNITSLFPVADHVNLLLKCVSYNLIKLVN